MARGWGVEANLLNANRDRFPMEESALKEGGPGGLGSQDQEGPNMLKPMVVKIWRGGGAEK